MSGRFVIRRRPVLAATIVSAAAVLGGSLIMWSGSGAKSPASRIRPPAAAKHTVPEGQRTKGRPVDAAVFSPGSCVSYLPTASGHQPTVFLDAAHGGADPGAVGSTQPGQRIHETDLTLPVELNAMGLLRAKGFTVVVSRTGPSSVTRIAADDVANGVLTVQGVHRDMAARDLCANLAKASILVGIQFNAGSAELNAGGLTVYDTARPFSQQNLQLAQLVQANVIAALNAQSWGIPDDGVLPDTALVGPATNSSPASNGQLLLGPAQTGFVSTPSQMPGAVIQPLFLTDPLEGSIAASVTGQRVIAQGLALAVEQYFGQPSTTTPPPPLPTLAPGTFAESTVGSVPVATVRRVPPAGPGQGAVSVAVFDPARTRLQLHAGSLQPVAGASLVFGPQPSALERKSLIAAFNAGFKTADSRGGWMSEGRTVVPLVPGAASVVIYADGGTDIGSWGQEVPDPQRVVASVRQNLQLLIDAGRPQLQGATSEKQLEQWWGVAFRGAPLVSRSALGVAASGALIWAAGTDITVTSLTDALVAQGAVRALELDINAPLVRGFLYQLPATVTTSTSSNVDMLPLVDGQTQTAADRTPAGSGANAVPHCTYLTTCSRDFFTVLAQ